MTSRSAMTAAHLLALAVLADPSAYVSPFECAICGGVLDGIDRSSRQPGCRACRPVPIPRPDIITMTVPHGPVYTVSHGGVVVIPAATVEIEAAAECVTITPDEFNSLGGFTGPDTGRAARRAREKAARRKRKALHSARVDAAGGAR